MGVTIINKEVKKRGFTAIRYVDDLAFFCESKSECLKAHDFCVDELKKLGLDVPSIGKNSKSQVYSPNQSAEFLGLELAKKRDSYCLLISDKQIQNIHEKFNAYSKIQDNLEKGLKFSSLQNKLENIVLSYKGHYGEAENYDAFEKKLYFWKDNVYKKLITNGFGLSSEQIENIGHKTRVFFHLVDRINIKPTKKF